ncbi:MAG: protein-L-isoaspartate(D-aspartate) O-methyltransferase [Planctomycetales bacterium]|nr:protein-L-isoaspartate(D-aspartate) O-methyltransferase [Planctomycetales bacterium]
MNEPTDQQRRELAAARHDMLSHQLLDRGVDAPDVLRAIAAVPREAFVPEPLWHEAYSDRALSIDCAQTISQPYIVGLMTQAVAPQGHEHVLDVGTGSGYQAAVLSRLARDVITIERHAPLSAAARRVIEALSYTNIEFVVGDGSLGWPAAAPYDAIVVAAAAPRCPPALFEQLAEGGRICLPVDTEHGQRLQVIRKVDGRARVRWLCDVRFVPLVGAQGKQHDD